MDASVLLSERLKFNPDHMLEDDYPKR